MRAIVNPLQLEYIADTPLVLESEQHLETFQNMLDALDDCDDVQAIHHNIQLEE